MLVEAPTIARLARTLDAPALARLRALVEGGVEAAGRGRPDRLPGPRSQLPPGAAAACGQPAPGRPRRPVARPPALLRRPAGGRGPAAGRGRGARRDPRRGRGRERRRGRGRRPRAPAAHAQRVGGRGRGAGGPVTAPPPGVGSRLMTDPDRSKRDAGEAAALLVEPGMRVGLGTGSTVAYLLAALARRGAARPALRGDLGRHRAPRRASWACAVEAFDALDRLDIAIDGADQVDPGRLADQGRRRRAPAREDRRRGGRAVRRHRRRGQARRRARAAGAARALAFGLPATLAALGEAPACAPDAPPSPDGGVIADYCGRGRRPGRAGGAARAVPRRRRPRAVRAGARARGRGGEPWRVLSGARPAPSSSGQRPCSSKWRRAASSASRSRSPLMPTRSSTFISQIDAPAPTRPAPPSSPTSSKPRAAATTTPDRLTSPGSQ